MSVSRWVAKTVSRNVMDSCTRPGVGLTQSHILQVPLTVAPEWLPIDFGKCAVASQALHGLLSGIIHLHVYALSSEQHNADVPAPHGPAHPSTSTLKASLILRTELAIDTYL